MKNYFLPVSFLFLAALFIPFSCSKTDNKRPCAVPKVEIVSPAQGSTVQGTLTLDINYLVGDLYDVLKESDIKIYMENDTTALFSDHIELGSTSGYYDKVVDLNLTSGPAKLIMKVVAKNDCNIKKEEEVSFTLSQ